MPNYKVYYILKSHQITLPNDRDTNSQDSQQQSHIETRIYKDQFPRQSEVYQQYIIGPWYDDQSPGDTHIQKFMGRTNWTRLVI